MKIHCSVQKLLRETHTYTQPAFFDTFLISQGGWKYVYANFILTPSLLVNKYISWLFGSIYPIVKIWTPVQYFIYSYSM
jgi:hypothetical protein